TGLCQCPGAPPCLGRGARARRDGLSNCLCLDAYSDGAGSPAGLEVHEHDARRRRVYTRLAHARAHHATPVLAVWGRLTPTHQRGRGRGAVKLCPLRRRRRGERGCNTRKLSLSSYRFILDTVYLSLLLYGSHSCATAAGLCRQEETTRWRMLNSPAKQDMSRFPS